ncbi:cd36 [Blomia tropicalis]|nr:cd36 [Blomia tropicalis]
MKTSTLVMCLAVCIGIILTLSGSIVLFSILPNYIRNKIADEMYIQNGTGDAYKRFRKLPITMKWKMHVFTVDDPSTFDGINIDSLRFHEIGPFVYDEFRHKTHIVMDKTGGNVTYLEKKKYGFNFKESVTIADHKEPIIIINPFLGAPREILSLFNVSLVLNDTIYNIAFNGSIQLLGEALFKCDECEQTARTIDTGKFHINQIGQLLKYGKNVGVGKFWNGTPFPKGHCNDIRGTDGTQFHPDISSDERLTVFEPMLCRSIVLSRRFMPDEPEIINVQHESIDTLRFVASESNFAHSPENRCYCYESDENDCKAGFLNLRSCPPASDYNVDIIATQPYFLTNHELIKGSGLDRLIKSKDITLEKYGTFLDIEPYTGLVLGAKKRVQLNVLLKRGSIPLLANLSKPEMLAPLMWIEESGVIDGKNAEILREKIFKPKAIITGLMVTFIIVGFGSIIGTIIFATWRRINKQKTTIN